MEKNDLIRLARNAGATPYTNRHYPDRPTHTFTVEQLQAFADSIGTMKMSEAEAYAKVMQAERDEYQQAADRYESYWNKATEKNRQMVSRMEALARIVMADQVAHDLPEIKSPKPLYQLITEENVRWLDEQEKTFNGENTCSQNSTT